MDINTINWLAVLAAALSTFLLGGIWYSSLLFGKAWMNENKFTAEVLKKGTGRIFFLSFICAFVMALNLAMFLNDAKTDLSWGAMAGFLASFGWIFMAIAIIGLFERKTLKYILINSGYMIVAFIVMGVILGAWR